MRTKAEVLEEVALTGDYNPHGGLPPDTKDVVLVEVLLDIRNELHELVSLYQINVDPGVKELLKSAGL